MLNQGPKIVTNGLVLCLDAANRKSYPGSGNTWYDLSGNDKHAIMNNLTSSNFVTFNGAKCFETTDAADQYFSISNYIRQGSNGRTCEIWIAEKSSSLSWQTWIEDSDSGGGDPFFGYNTAMYLYPQSFGTLTLNEWYHIVYTLVGGNGSDVEVYVNGESRGVQTYTGQVTSGSGTIYLLGDASAFNEQSSVYCSAVKIYNRVLSAAEIKQNYTALKSRFGHS